MTKFPAFSIVVATFTVLGLSSTAGASSKSIERSGKYRKSIAIDAEEALDTDEDGVPNHIDEDDDNDCLDDIDDDAPLSALRKVTYDIYGDPIEFCSEDIRDFEDMNVASIVCNHPRAGIVESSCEWTWRGYWNGSYDECQENFKAWCEEEGGRFVSSGARL